MAEKLKPLTYTKISYGGKILWTKYPLKKYEIFKDHGELSHSAIIYSNAQVDVNVELIAVFEFHKETLTLNKGEFFLNGKKIIFKDYLNCLLSKKGVEIGKSLPWEGKVFPPKK